MRSGARLLFPCVQSVTPRALLPPSGLCPRGQQRGDAIPSTLSSWDHIPRVVSCHKFLFSGSKAFPRKCPPAGFSGSLWPELVLRPFSLQERLGNNVEALEWRPASSARSACVAAGAGAFHPCDHPYSGGYFTHRHPFSFSLALFFVVIVLNRQTEANRS